jgi:hypothetical protein
MITVALILVCIGAYDQYTDGKHSEAIIATLIAAITAPMLFGKWLYKKVTKD